MLFSSFVFILLFLPFTLTGYYLLRRVDRGEWAFFFLIVASFYFYGYGELWFLPLLVFSIIVNYFVEKAILRSTGVHGRRFWFFVGLAINLGLLGYFKYANFFMDNLNALFNTDWNLEKIVLPLGISFYTFQQITLLLDAYSEKHAHQHNMISHALFITFFPQLIAGPIVHHKEMIPQFQVAPERQLWRYLAIGMTVFTVGLAKKVLIADTMAMSVNGVFGDAAGGLYHPHLLESWGALIAYSFQIYFDFSGYSDMAVGLAYMFGIRIPINFASPYKSRSIIEFWSRWHVTLSRLIMEYIYSPLGLKFMRHAMVKGWKKWPAFWFGVALPVMITFLLAGFWHGAGWNFILFGAMHGVAMTINHAWRQKKLSMHPSLAWLATFLTINLTWVPFRAENPVAMVELYKGLTGLNGISLPLSWVTILQRSIPEVSASLNIFASGPGFIQANHMLYLVPLLFVVVLRFPNTYEWLGPDLQPGLASRGYAATEVRNKAKIFWRPNLVWAWGMAGVFAWSVANLYQVTEFIYFHF